MRSLIEDLIAAGVHGLTPLGSTGEAPYLSAWQREEIVRIAVDQAAGRVPVVAGLSAYSTSDGIAQARKLNELGASGVVAMLSAYFPLPAQRIVEHFREVADAAEIPVVVYTNPRYQGYEISLTMLAAMAESTYVRYLKDASGVTGRLLAVRRAMGDRIGIFAASAHIPLFVMMIGGKGWMAGPACLAPSQSVRLYDLARQGRWADALPLQERLWALNEVFQKFDLAACVKAGLELQGYDVGDPVAPQRALSQVEREEVAEVLRQVGALPARRDG